MRALETRFLDLSEVAFWDGQVFENKFEVTLEPFKHCFLNSPKSLFGLVNRKKISSKCLATT